MILSALRGDTWRLRAEGPWLIQDQDHETIQDGRYYTGQRACPWSAPGECMARSQHN